MYFNTSRTNVDTLANTPMVDTQTWLDALYSNETIDLSYGAAVPHKHSTNFCRVYTTTTTRPVCALTRTELFNIKVKLNTLKAAIGHIGQENLTYTTFHIPKSSGGYREINAPDESLKALQLNLVDILKSFRISAHDCAYAYVEHRCCRDALVEHQRNQSKWFLKLDLKHFFNNCTPEFVNTQLGMLSNIVKDEEAHVSLTECLNKLAYLNNGLPQGTPISPLLTNLIMIPIDYTLSKYFHDKSKRNFVYTRYADDLLISSKYNFTFQEVIDYINSVFLEYNAPFTINNDKTRYGSSAGSNWNLGLMLNKDNNITIGHKENQRLRAAINNFLKDFTTTNRWSIIDTQILLGKLSYARSINLDYYSFVVKRLEGKYNLSFFDCCKTILN